MSIVGEGLLDMLTKVLHSLSIGGILTGVLEGGRGCSRRSKEVLLLVGLARGITRLGTSIEVSISISSSLLGVTVGATRAASTSSTTTTTSIRVVVVVALSHLGV